MLSRQWQRGFTLIELMVVVVIIGLFASMVMLTVTPNNSHQLEREAKRLMQVLRLAEDEAVLQGVELGFTLEQNRYYFSRLQDNQWRPLTEDRQFSRYDIDEALTVELEVEDELVVKKVDEKQRLPAVMLLSSGETTGFKITLYDLELPNHKFQIIGQENGQLSLQSPDE